MPRADSDLYSSPLPFRSVLIFEVTEPNFPPHEAVRIFVQFSRPEEATKVGEQGQDGGALAC